MTEREICESIVSDGGCRKINCDGIKYYGYIINEGTPCPLQDMCFSEEDEVELAKQWLEEHKEGCDGLLR